MAPSYPRDERYGRRVISDGVPKTGLVEDVALALYSAAGLTPA